MAKLYNLARMTTATTGTGTLTLSLAVSGFLSFATAGIADGEIVTYAIEDGTNSEIGRGVYTASGTTLTRNVLKSTNSNNAISLSGSAQVFITPAAEDLVGVWGFEKFSLAASVVSNALTISLKDGAGSDASAAAPIDISFRSATATTGTPVTRSLTAGLSLTISSGSKLGTSNNVPFRIWVVVFDDAGTLRLGAIQRVVGGSSPTSMANVSDDMLASSTAEGGLGAANSAGVFYTGTAVSSKALRILGYVEYSSGLNAAGTYNVAPTKVQSFGPGVKRPGDVVQSTYMQSTTSFSSTSTTFVDSGVNQAITMSSAPNLIRGRASGPTSPQSAAMFVVVAFFRDATQIRGATSAYAGGGPQIGGAYIETLDAPGDTSSHTYYAKMKVVSGSTASYFPYCGNGEAGMMTLEEIMA